MTGVAGAVVQRLPRTTAATVIRITLRLSVLPEATVTSRTMAAVTDFHTLIAPLFGTTSTPPFVAFGVCETIGLRPRPELHLHPQKRCRQHQPSQYRPEISGVQ
jgi:hypothetical protein